MRNYKISVAMATYNGEKYIYEQLESILRQLNENDEVIISDDASSDSTLEIIKSFKDSRIFIFPGPKKGFKQNFANAINKCSGKYIFLSDQDDIWLDNKVEKILYAFEHGNYLCIQHDACVIDSEDKKILIKSLFDIRKTRSGALKNIIKNSYTGCCMAFDNKIKKIILPIPNDIDSHDQWIGVLCDIYGKTYCLNEVLIKYRRHTNNVSRLKHYPLLKMIKNRLNLCINLFKRCKYL